MEWLRTEAEYVQPRDTFVPGPKYGHYIHREPDELVDLIETAADKALGDAWGIGRTEYLSVDELKQNLIQFQPVFPEGCPEPVKDFNTYFVKAPMRDGAEIELKVYKGKKAKKDATMVLRLHGGGFVVGNHETEEPENRYIAAMDNVILISVDYRMAPEYIFPIPLNDSYDALIWCKENSEKLGFDPERIIVAGCSAGGNLAAVVTNMALANGVTGIIGQILTIPVLCHPKFINTVPNASNYELKSWTQNQEAPLLDSRRMETFWDLYVGKEPEPHLHHSPLLSEDLSGLPATLLQVAGKDPLRDEGLAYAQALQAAGVLTESVIYTGMPHGFYGFPGTKQAKEYHIRIMAFVEECTKRAKETV